MLKSKTPAVVEGYDQGMGSAAVGAASPYINSTRFVSAWQAPHAVGPSIKTRREQRWKSIQSK